ncbi:response regulator transcription factor [Thermotoga sp. KOL6]|uniref:response regulator transcription factor n=1 Tax=Thermotoga sp. KOL6 TaxID=126741 RepID=UPI000CB0C543|nr:response regulator transcription factor [Thermotoga sp. KOL6]PLV59974.1 two-component system response regulator [Thermotoga sp. KOL6]
MGIRVLIAEDDEDIRSVLKRYLEAEGFECDEVGTLFDLKKKLSENVYSVVLLDLMFPDGIAMDEIPEMKVSHPETAILIISARDRDLDRIFGIELGADDYITKPFNPREVIARVKAILRRMGKEQKVLKFGKLEIFLEDYLVRYDGKIIEMTAKEFEVLKLLAITPNKVFSREEILDRVWKDEYVSDRVVDVHISAIRAKIGKGWIKTVRGLGYKFSSRGDENDRS